MVSSNRVTTFLRSFTYQIWALVTKRWRNWTWLAATLLIRGCLYYSTLRVFIVKISSINHIDLYLLFHWYIQILLDTAFKELIHRLRLFQWILTQILFRNLLQHLFMARQFTFILILWSELIELWYTMQFNINNNYNNDSNQMIYI